MPPHVFTFSFVSLSVPINELLSLNLIWEIFCIPDIINPFSVRPAAPANEG